MACVLPHETKGERPFRNGRPYLCNMNQQGDYIRPDLQPGQWAVFWDSQTPDRYLIARYSHSERTTPFDRHWTQGKEYFAECLPQPLFHPPVSPS